MQRGAATNQKLWATPLAAIWTVPEHRDNRAQRHLRELEEAAFDSIGDGNPENPAEHFPVKAENQTTAADGGHYPCPR